MDNLKDENKIVPEDVTSLVDDVVNQNPAEELANKMEQDLKIQSTEVPNSTPAMDLDGDEATDEKPAIPGVPPVEEKASVPEQPFAPQGMPSSPFAPTGQPMGGMNQPQFGQPMGGMNQPQFGQPMGGMNQPQFGQPMGGVNQPQFGQPMGGMNQPPVGKPPKVKKPLSKGAIGGIIGGGIALVALIVCAIIFIPKFFRSDKEVVVDAFEATFGVETDTTQEDAFGSQDIIDKFATTGGKREFGFTVTENFSGENLSMGANYSEVIDVKNRLANGDMLITYNDSNLLNMKMVLNDENVYVQLPELINGYFTIPSNNGLQALENSEIGQLAGIEGMPALNFAESYFDAATSTAPTEINGEYVAIVEKLWDSITYEKQGKAKIDVNGETVTAKEYFVTVPQDSAKEAIKEFWDALVAELAANTEYLAEMGMDASTFESTMGSYSSMFTSLIKSDLVVKVYIVDDKIVKIVCADELNLYGTEIAYNFSLDLGEDAVSGICDFAVMGESAGLKFNVDSMKDKPTGKISLYTPDETVDVNFNGTVTTSGTKESYDIAYDVVYNGTTYVDGKIVSNYDNSSYTMDGNVVVNLPNAGKIDINYAGGFKDVKKGEAYTFELSKCEVKADGESMIDMTAYVKLDTTQTSASGVDSSLPVYDLTTMSEDDLENVITDNMSLIESWMEANSDLFGSYEAPTITAPSEPEEPEETTMTLVGTDKSVEILGTIDGFEVDMTSEYYIYFETENWSYVEYYIYEGFTPEEIVGDIYIPTEGVLVQELSQTMDLEGETIYYSYVQSEEYGYKYSEYLFAKDIGDGIVLVASAGIYDDEDTFTKEQLVQALSSQYYKIVE